MKPAANEFWVVKCTDVSQIYVEAKSMPIALVPLGLSVLAPKIFR